MAPMVDQSELSFRMLGRMYGVDLAYSPMLHARLCAEQPGFLEKFFTTCPADRPLVVQFAGDDPDTVLAAAKKVEKFCDAVDLNLGCPQGIARRGHYGAFLLEETDTICAIVRKLHENLSIPVTVKIRKLRTWEDTIRTVLALQDAGASIITVHGRLKENIKERICATDWNTIARIKAHPGVRIPIFANGGIGCYEDVAACIAATGVDGVMSSEALLENPGLFSDGWPTLPGTQVRLCDAMVGAGGAAASSSASGGDAAADGSIAAAGGAGAADAVAGSGAGTDSAVDAAHAGSWLQPRHARRSDCIDFAWAYLQLAGHYEEDLGAVRGHLVKMLFAPLKIHTALRNAFLSASGGVRAWQALLVQLARMYKHPLAAAADAAAAAGPAGDTAKDSSSIDSILPSYALEVARRTSHLPLAVTPRDGAAAAARLGLAWSPVCADGAGAGVGSASATAVGPSESAGSRAGAAPDAAGSAAGPLLLANQLPASAWSGCSLLRPRPADRAAAHAALTAKRSAKGAAKKAKRAGGAAGAGEGEGAGANGAAASGSGAAGESVAAAADVAVKAERPASCYDEHTDDAASAAGAAATADGESAPPAKRARVASEGAGEATTAAAVSDADAVSHAASGGADAAPSKAAAKAAAAAAAMEAAAAVIQATDWASFVGRTAAAEDWEEWRTRRAAEPSAGYSKPDFLVDPLQPGLWYMRHQAILPRSAGADAAAAQGSASAADVSSGLATSASSGAGAAPVPPAALTVGAVAATLRYGGRCGRKDGPEAFLAGLVRERE